MTAGRYALAVICCVVCGVGLSWAVAGTTKKRHQHGVHVHGTAAVNIAIDRGAAFRVIHPHSTVDHDRLLLRSGRHRGRAADRLCACPTSLSSLPG